MFPLFLLLATSLRPRAARSWLPLLLVSILVLCGWQSSLLANPEHSHTQSAGTVATDAATTDTFTMLNWATRTAAPAGLSEAQTVTINGKVYSFGGFYDSSFRATARVDVYDPVTDSWTSKGSMPTVLTHAGFTTDGQTVYVIGGYVGNHPGPATADTWKYDVASNTWTPFVPLPEPRGAGAAVLLGREIHFFGGMDLTRTINQSTHYVLNLDEGTPTWRTLAPLPVARNHLGGAVLGGKIYALGGQLNEESSAVPQSVAHVYDPATNAWTQIASLPKNRSQHGAGTFVHGNRIITIGGEDKVARPLADVTAYDPVTNTWTVLSPLPEARRSGIAGSTGDALIYSQGWTPNVQNATTWSGTPGTVNVLRVNAGSYPGYVDTVGQFWAADANYNTGSIARTSNPIALTNDDWIYQTEHAGNFNYTFPVANGNYTLRLHFAELYFSNPGQRKFNVSAEGQTVLSNYDIVARSGAINTAIVETVAVTISDGKLDMSFSGVVNSAKISAFELIPAGGSGTLTLTRLQGDGQTGTVGSTLPQPLVVEVKNSAGTLQSGITVNFAATNGSVSPGTVTTGSDGRASTTLTLGNNSGTATVNVSASGATGTSFTATVTTTAPAPASKLALSPSSGTVAVGTPVTYQVSVQDQSGNTVVSPNQTVTFTLSGVSGSFSPSATVTTSNGTASVTLTATTPGNATVNVAAAGLTGASSSLVVTSGSPPSSFVAALNSGGPSYTSVSGGAYTADTYFSGGRTNTVTSNPIASTNDDTLYQTERSAAGFSYAIPVPNGSYSLRLHFAEIYWNNVGQRVFNVSAEGQAVLSNYDILARAGGKFTAVVETIAVTVSDGVLNLTFGGVVGNAKISAIDLAPVAGNGLVLTKVQGDGQTGTVGSTLPQPLVVEVKNSAGTLQSGITVNFAATNGSVSPGTVTTGSDGRASTTLTLGNNSGTATVNVSASGATGTSFTATVTTTAPAPASKLALSPSSGTVAVGTPVTYQVSVQDQSGNTVVSPNQTVTFTLSGVSGSFSPSATVTTSNGTASVTLTATTPGNATVNVAAAGLTGASSSLVVTSGSPPSSFVAALNSGGPSYTSVSGGAYTADTYFSGGRTNTVTSNPIASTNDDTLYQTERSAAGFSYAIPVPNGSYSLRLHFAEIYWNNVGQRVFNVSAEGQAVLSNYDILARAGGKFTAVVETIAVTVSDGVLNLTFGGVVGNAKISAIDLSPAVIEDHFLHVVIGAPSYAVDYDANGSESVSLKGSDSHTHQIGRQLNSWTWQDGQATVGTQPNIATSLSLGDHTLSLTITDDSTPPQTLSGSASLPVYPKNAVGGVLTGYYPSGGIPISTMIDSLPTAASYLEVLPGLALNATSGKVGGSPYTGDLVTVLTGTYNAATAGTYQFSTSGGLERRLYIDGAPVSGPLNLSAGPHAIEARFSVNTTAVLPARVLVAVNGGAATPVPTANLRHDETNLLPFINTMPTTGAGAGGELVTIRGIGFFPAGSVQVRWGSAVLSGTAITVAPDAITLITPPGSNTVAVTVQTPNGISNAVNFTYNAAQAAISFTTRYVTDTPSPTQAAWGPDGRLYVLSVAGSLSIYTFDDNYNITATQVVNSLTTLPNSNTIGIAFNPHDPIDKIRIYVAHASLFAQGGGCPTGPFPYNGQVSLLEGPDFAVVQPLVTGLGVSNYDHGINALAFDDSGDLFIANGSATNAGITDCALGGLPESPLSAAILKAQLSKPGFNGNIQYVESATGLANNDERSGGVVAVVPGVDVSVFASGQRNPFDVVWTTRGRLYGSDNGANNGFGAASTSATTQSPDQPTAPDEINLLQQGNYYGHPNRNRGRTDARQNVYHYGTEGSIAGVYTAPLVTVASSTDGIDEYRATTFNSQMRGNLLVQKYRGNTFSARLSADGTAISEVTTLQGGPTTGLDVLAGPGGVILSFNYDGDVINLSRPNDTTAPPMVAYDIFPFRAKRDGTRTFTIGGVGFGTPGNTTVTIGGVQAVLTSVSSTRIRGLIPASSRPAADYLDVVVQSAGRQSAIPAAFRYLGSP